MLVATSVLLVAATYSAIGAIFAAVFVMRGVSTVDHAATGSRWTFRVLILPGVAALWPIMLARWIRAGRRA